MDVKLELAKKAVSLIKQDMVVGLGASSTMKNLVDCLSVEIKKGLRVKLVSSSFTTQQLLLENGLDVYPVASYTGIDIYFDGCDQFDKNLNAVKSGGGIHTREKLLASMAKQFILLGDKTKYVDAFDIKFPMVLEVLPDACRYVQDQVLKAFPGASTTLRISDKKIGAAVTDNGNYLLDVWFSKWPEAAAINHTAKQIAGIVETSFFYGLAHAALLPEGERITIIESPRK